LNKNVLPFIEKNKKITRGWRINRLNFMKPAFPSSPLLRYKDDKEERFTDGE